MRKKKTFWGDDENFNEIWKINGKWKIIEKCVFLWKNLIFKITYLRKLCNCEKIEKPKKNFDEPTLILIKYEKLIKRRKFKK